MGQAETVLDQSSASSTRRASEHAIRNALVSGAVGKVGNTALNLVIIALSVRALGPSAYGVITVVAGLTGTVVLFDLGIGSGTISILSAALARRDLLEARRIVSSALVALLAIGSTVAGIGAIGAMTVPATLLFHAPGVDVFEVRLTLALFFISLGMTIPGLMGSRICMAQQFAVANALWTNSATALIAVGVGIAYFFHTPLWIYAFITLMTPSFVFVGQTIHYLYYSKHAILPNWRHVSKQSVIQIAKDSAPFTAIGGTHAIGYQAGTIVTAYALDTSAAAVLGIAIKTAFLAGTLFSTGLEQGWASSARAIAIGDYQWVRRTFWRILFATTGITALVSIAVVVFGPIIIRVWVGPELVPPLDLRIATAIWATSSVALSQMSFLLNAFQVLWPQATMALITAVLTPPVTIALVRTMGVAGAPVAAVVVNAVFTGGPSSLYLRQRLRLGRIFHESGHGTPSPSHERLEH